MRIDGKNVLANPVEKFLAFGKQNMGKPAILDGNLVLVKNSMFWRLCLFTSIIIAVFSQYVFAALPWFISIMNGPLWGHFLYLNPIQIINLHSIARAVIEPGVIRTCV